MRIREMNKKLLIFMCMISCAVSSAPAAVTIKKAAPVATQAASVQDTGASLVPTVLGLVSGVQQLNAKQRELTQECIPTSQEITFVNNAMKEWAKVGEMTSDDAKRALGRMPCPGGTGYQMAVRTTLNGDDGDLVCYDNFGSSGDKNTVWYLFPKASVASYCDDGSQACKNKKTVSDIYDIFNLIDFSESDYTKTEATMAAKLLSKIENCSNSRLSAKKRAMWGEFLTSTVGGLGQKTNTSSIMETVSGLSSGGGMSSLGAIVSQFADK